MTRLLTVLLLLAFAAPLSGCGIKGNLKTPPPLWGETTDADIPQETTTAESIEDGQEPLADPLDEDDEDDVGYGIDVADTP